MHIPEAHQFPRRDLFFFPPPHPKQSSNVHTLKTSQQVCPSYTTGDSAQSVGERGRGGMGGRRWGFSKTYNELNRKEAEGGGGERGEWRREFVRTDSPHVCEFRSGVRRGAFLDNAHVPDVLDTGQGRNRYPEHKMLHYTKKFRTWKQMTDSTIASHLASPYPLRVSVC